MAHESSLRRSGAPQLHVGTHANQKTALSEGDAEMNAKQRDRHERKMYLKGLRYGARYEVITTPAIRELIVNKKKIRRQQIWRLRGTEGYHLHMGSKRRKSK